MKKWEVKEKYDGKDILDTLLKVRGLEKPSERKKFLEPPEIKDLKFSKEFNDSLKKASEIIKSFMEKDSPIVVHGDYDADGICASAILHRAFRKDLGYKNSFSFIPNRFEHGYGLSIASLDAIVQKLSDKDLKPGLLITVDSGITSVEEVAYAKKLGFKVIITDHHQKPSKLPKAECIVWNDQIVGAGVAFFLAKGLGATDKGLISLAAIGTVTDLQPLFNFNRSIVKWGLERLNKNPYEGIKALRKVSDKDKGDVTTYDLGWVFGPRINAMGRMGDATTALKLLINDDKGVVTNLAKELNMQNMDRQDKTVEMFDLASEFDDQDLPKIIISSNKDYHEGIIGLVAARLVQKHFRPSIVISLDEKFGKGSVRSIPGINITEVLRLFEDLFVSVGGHPMAAGFTIEVEKIPLLEEKLITYADENILEEHLVPVVSIDLEIPFGIVDMQFVKELRKLRPFGMGNKSPVFLSRGAVVEDISSVGREKNHLSMKLFADGKDFRAIFFGGGEYKDEINIGDVIDVVYSAEENHFNGRSSVSIVVKDIKKSIE